MIEQSVSFSSNKKEMYEEVVLQLRGLFEDCPYMLANFANASAVLNQAMEDINWVGFYFLRSKDSKEGLETDYGKKEAGQEEESLLVLGPFQGKPACVEIQIGKGICGTAVAKDEVMLVKDVHEFPGHIACDAASRSEIVLPIHAGGKIVGVLDIDSPKLARFDEEDKSGLKVVVKILEEMCENSSK